MTIVMRYPEGHKDAVKDRIVLAAAKAFRRQGLEGVSIPALMKEVGLTHGGFYAHFAKRENLVAEAVLAAARETEQTVFGPGLPLQTSMARYLSEEHLAHPGAGCVLAALGANGTRQSSRVRQAFAEVARGFLALLETKVNPKGDRQAVSQETLRRASMMVGAVVLGRLVRDRALASRILAAVRETPPA